MMKFNANSSVFLLVLVSSSFQLINCILRAEFSSTSLPFYIRDSAYIYDGDDFIYIYGGANDDLHQKILRYSISFDEILEVGSFPTYSKGGTVQDVGNGSYIYFGTDMSWTAHAYKYNSKDNTTEVLRKPPFSTFRSASVLNSNDDGILLFGGRLHWEALYSYNISSDNYNRVGSLPTQWSLDGVQAVKLGNFVYLIGIFPLVNGPSRFLRVDLESFQTELLEDPKFNTYTYGIKMTYDGSKYIYLILGYFGDDQGSPGIFQFNPETLENKLLSIEDWPMKDPNVYSIPPNPVHVKKLNRIYFFGGVSCTTFCTDWDHIWWVDLEGSHPNATTTTENSLTTTLNPNEFSCRDRPNGFYPHPYDCSMFIICHDEETQTFQCPQPLLYNPEKKVCDLPENVECPLTCIGRPNGHYPHPHDCSMFIICNHEDLLVFQCPPPLLFHPIDHICLLPEHANCTIPFSP